MAPIPEYIEGDDFEAVLMYDTALSFSDSLDSTSMENLKFSTQTGRKDIYLESPAHIATVAVDVIRNAVPHTIV